MNKQDILKDYKNQEDRILVSYILDKIKFVETRNKLESTNFLSLYQISLVEKFLKKIKFNNYYLWGGFETAERKVLIIFPEKYTHEMIEKNYNKIMSIIRINLSEQEKGKYTHRNYLGGIVKLGLEREKIGDILVHEEGADIIILKEVEKFLIQELPMLKRFEGSNIKVENIENVKQVEPKLEELKIIVPSLRLDNFVSDLARTSRNKAVEIIKSERVFINGSLETKTSKQVKEKDTITIRGKGRFIIKEISGNTRSGRTIVIIEKFV